MAKKKAARGDFNMSEEIRNLLKNDASMSSREVFEALVRDFPGQEINRNSCNVAFSHARRKLGIKGSGNRAVRHRRPSVAVSSSVGSLNLGILQAARELLSQAGSPEAAVQAIQDLQALQLN